MKLEAGRAITGASRGLDLAIARTRAEGASVVRGARGRGTRRSRRAGRLGVTAITAPADVTQDAEVAAAVATLDRAARRAGAERRHLASAPIHEPPRRSGTCCST